MDAQTRNEIEARINKAEKLELEIDVMTQGEDGLAEMIAKTITANILFELLESLAGGETLEQAIETIHSNF